MKEGARDASNSRRPAVLGRCRRVRARIRPPARRSTQSRRDAARPPETRTWSSGSSDPRTTGRRSGRSSCGQTCCSRSASSPAWSSPRTVSSPRGGLPTFKSAVVTTGGIIAAIASIIPIGAVNAGVWLRVLRLRLQGDRDRRARSGRRWSPRTSAHWFKRVGSVIIALGLSPSSRGRRARSCRPRCGRGPGWLVIALIIAPILGVTEITDPSVEELVSALTGVVLVPVWAVWVGRSVDAAGAASATA